MRYFILCLFCSINSLVISQSVIHRDAYDIKKTNITINLFLRAQGRGPQLRLSHYVSNRIRLLYNGYIGVGDDRRYHGYGEYAFGPAEKWNIFMVHELEGDFHMIDHAKEKYVNIALAWNRIDANTRSETYTSMDGVVRRILSLTGGVQYIQKKEEMYRATWHRKFYLHDIQANKDVELNKIEMINGVYETTNAANTVYTNANYTNVLLGLKFKSISANGVEVSGYGKKYNDMHLETYFSLIVPVGYGMTKDLYTNWSKGPTHQIIDQKPKTGFKAGIFHRNSIKNFWCIGGEIGVLPTIRAKYGQGFFINVTMGFSLNFGKIRLL